MGATTFTYQNDSSVYALRLRPTTRLPEPTDIEGGAYSNLSGYPRVTREIERPGSPRQPALGGPTLNIEKLVLGYP